MLVHPSQRRRVWSESLDVCVYAEDSCAHVVKGWNHQSDPGEEYVKGRLSWCMLLQGSPKGHCQHCIPTQGCGWALTSAAWAQIGHYENYKCPQTAAPGFERLACDCFLKSSLRVDVDAPQSQMPFAPHQTMHESQVLSWPVPDDTGYVQIDSIGRPQI
eukprot:286732-Amphidinium_carterae.1